MKYTSNLGDKNMCDEKKKITGDSYIIHLAQIELNKIDSIDNDEAPPVTPESQTPKRGPIGDIWRAAAEGKLADWELAEW